MTARETVIGKGDLGQQMAAHTMNGLVAALHADTAAKTAYRDGL